MVLVLTGTLARTVVVLACSMTAVFAVAAHQSRGELPDPVTWAAWLLAAGALVVLLAGLGRREDGEAPWRARLAAERSVA